MIRILAVIVLLWILIVPSESFLFPLLFPVQIKITFTARKPPPIISTYHFETAPVYKEIVVKQTAHPQKQSYGDGHHQYSSFGDGHVKVYHEEPHVKDHKYSSGYGTTAGYPKPIYSKGKKTHVGGTYDLGAYPEVSHPLVAPPSTYEEISEEDKEYYPQTYLPQEHVKYGSRYQNKPQYNGKYIEEYPSTYYDHEDARYVPQYDDSTEIRSTQYKDNEPLLYAGFGSTFYGDSYAKIIYKPKPIKVSISAYSH